MGIFGEAVVEDLPSDDTFGRSVSIDNGLQVIFKITGTISRHLGDDVFRDTDPVPAVFLEEHRVHKNPNNRPRDLGCVIEQLANLASDRSCFDVVRELQPVLEVTSV